MVCHLPASCFSDSVDVLTGDVFDFESPLDANIADRGSTNTSSASLCLLCTLFTLVAPLILSIGGGGGVLVVGSASLILSIDGGVFNGRLLITDGSLSVFSLELRLESSGEVAVFWGDVHSSNGDDSEGVDDS